MDDDHTKDVTIAVRSPDLHPESVSVVVTLPTFRRPDHLLSTLDSIAGQITARRFAVIVMENDAEGRQGLNAARQRFEAGESRGLVIIAHRRGNCSAYNAGWTTALAQFPACRQILVIDDDEIADPSWLERMCSASEELGVDIVGGPQVPVFPDPAGESWARHPVFAPPYRVTGEVSALYSSGNLLVGRHVLDAMERPFLDETFNFMGGGDSDFLSRAARKGFRLGWAADAPVYETVPARRLEADWIRARSLRNGVISTLVERRKRAGDPLGRLRVAAKSLALLGASPLRGFVRLVRTGSFSIGIYPVYVAMGRLMAEFGYVNEQYRQPEKN